MEHLGWNIRSSYCLTMNTGGFVTLKLVRNRPKLAQRTIQNSVIGEITK